MESSTTTAANAADAAQSDAGAVRDAFAVLGLPRKLGIDAAALKKEFHALNRKYHPDLFHQASGAERAQAIARSTEINDAYNCLRDRIRRVEHLLELEGRVLDQQTDSVPPQFFELVMEVNMAAQEAKESQDPSAKANLDKAAATVAAEMTKCLDTLSNVEQAWDAWIEEESEADAKAGLVDRLHAALKEILYLKRLERTIRSAGDVLVAP